MKILIATDGSEHCKAMVKKFADRTFAPNTKVRIISAYDGSSYITDGAPMGVTTEYYDTVNKYLKKSAENASESAATILRKKIQSFLFLLLPLMALQKVLSCRKRKNLAQI